MKESARILKAFDLFGDRRSREIFLSHIRWRLHLDYDALPVPVNETIYFNDRLIRPSSTEFLIDGGAFTGDTVESFLETFGKKGFQKIISFEPDPVNFPRLQDYVASLPPEIGRKVMAYPCALGEASRKINVESSGGPSSRVGYGNHEVACRTIDEFADDEAAPSFIKLDIEGFEIEALKGARNIISTKAPVVSACTYHVQNHLWEIQLLLQDMQPDYQYYLVPHLSDGWDLVLYAASPGRLVNSL
jgi:FkbM family methyltransferase